LEKASNNVLSQKSILKKKPYQVYED
jgi:hypothetical protein